VARTELGYVPYHLLEGRPNVVVDGSPTEGTVLTLTHWPSYPPPAGFEADTSAEMAFAYLISGSDLHSPARAVSNNHFDQDGLVALAALADPGNSLPRRQLLVDLALAGDFATYTDRRAARISMTVAAYADPARSPLKLSGTYAEQTAQLYSELLGRLPELCDHPGRYESWWADEDAALAHSEALIASGAVAITEYPNEDLAVVDVPESEVLSGGHRFAHEWADGVHPCAIHNATQRLALLTRQGHRYRFVFRYESWVQYRSRPVRARRDLTPLAERLSALEPGGGTWVYEGSGMLVPALQLVGAEESALAPDTFVSLVRELLAEAPPDWDPYQPKAG
jgi:hypothetical protein